MIRVMLLDDEMLVKVGLKSLINWEENGYQIVAEASNGEEGLKLIKNKKPEIVIVDIKMPLKDGITLIEEVKKMGLDTEFIVLSSFDDFNLVKKAMKLGAVDYLLKLELNEEDLLKSLESASKKISSDQKSRKNKDRKDNFVEMKKKTLQKFIAGVITEKEKINQVFADLNIELKEEKILCIIIKIEDKEILKKFSQGDIRLYEDSIINIVSEIVNDFYNAVVFMNNWGEIVVFLNLNNNLESEKNKIEKMNTRLHKMINNYFSLSITTAVSRLKENYFELREAFIECSECLNYSFRCVDKRAIYFTSLEEFINKETSDYINKFTFNFDEFLEYREIKKAVKLIEKIIHRVKENHLNRNDAFNLYFKITDSLEKNLNKEIIEQLCGSNNLYQNIESITNNQKLIIWLQNLSEKLIDYFNNQQHNYIILEAKKHLKNNYSQELSLESTAKKINVSSGYLSYLFKEECGISFTEYLNQLRITEAKNLLKTKKLKIYEIAAETGYNNPYYFSRVFKKNTGLSPSEYRNNY